jgi:hypothetical protein
LISRFSSQLGRFSSTFADFSFLFLFLKTISGASRSARSGESCCLVPPNGFIGNERGDK